MDGRFTPCGMRVSSLCFASWCNRCAEERDPIKTLVDTANALIERLATVNTEHGEGLAWRTAMQYGSEVSRLRDAIDAMEGRDEG